jgi:hypothetical protein
MDGAMSSVLRDDGSLRAVAKTKRLDESAETRYHEAHWLRDGQNTWNWNGNVDATRGVSGNLDRIEGSTLASVVGNTDESSQRVAGIGLINRSARAGEARALSVNEDFCVRIKRYAYPALLRKISGPAPIVMTDTGMLAFLLG